MKTQTRPAAPTTWHGVPVRKMTRAEWLATPAGDRYIDAGGQACISDDATANNGPNYGLWPVEVESAGDGFLLPAALVPGQTYSMTAADGTVTLVEWSGCWAAGMALVNDPKTGKQSAIDPTDIASGAVVITTPTAAQNPFTDNDYRVAARRTYESETIDIPLSAKVRDGEDWEGGKWVECWVLVDDDNAALRRIASGEDPR